MVKTAPMSPTDAPTDLQSLLLLVARTGPAGQVLASLILAGAGALFFLQAVVWVLRFVGWLLHRRDVKRGIPSQPPPPPPRGLVVLAVVAAGALSALLAMSAMRTFATRGGEDRACPPRCPAGEECVEGGNGRRYCGKQAKPAIDAPSAPESAVSTTETPTVYRRNPFVRTQLD